MPSRAAHSFKRCRPLVLPLCLAVIFVTLFSIRNSAIPQLKQYFAAFPFSVDEKADSESSQAKNFRQCLLSKNITWPQLGDMVNDCISKHINVKKLLFDYFDVNVSYAHSKTELKTFLHMKKQQDSCLWLTIGIGGETGAEKDFIKQYPSCKLFGVEAGEKIGDFNTFGKVLPYAVGSAKSRAKKEKESIRVWGNFGGGRSFNDTFMETYSLEEIITKFLPSRFIDFMTIDIEAAEYRVLPDLEKTASSIHQDFVICQIDAELHDPTFQRRLMPPDWKFEDFWMKFILNSSYLPVKVSKVFNLHYKITFVNFESVKCVKNLDALELFLIPQL